MVLLEPVSLESNLLQFVGEFCDGFGMLLVFHLQESDVLFLALP